MIREKNACRRKKGAIKQNNQLFMGPFLIFYVGGTYHENVLSTLKISSDIYILIA